jgi:hypothetical protein
MFSNVYFFAQESLPFHWNDLIYNTIDEWRADTGLDANSQFFIGPFRSRPRGRRPQLPRIESMATALEALMREPTLRPEMFHKLHRLANEGN